MCIKPVAAAPPTLLVLTLVCWMGLFVSREAFLTEGFPAFVSPAVSLKYVELVTDEGSLGVCQFGDVLELVDVINLTSRSCGNLSHIESCLATPLSSGEKLKLVKKERKIEVLRNGWMSSGERIALGIPLHPDQMTLEDWFVLPGIGEKLAERIELNRQKNGDFQDFKSLVRIKGVGQKRIDAWRDFF